MRVFLAVIILSVLSARAAVPTFESLEPSQFETNGFRVAYKAVHTNEFGIIYPALTNLLSLVTNENVYGTFSLPSKVEILTLGTNYLDVSTNSTWLLNSPTNDPTQVILSLSAGAYQGQLLFITSQNGGNSFTLPDLSEQYDVPGAYVDIQGDWTGTTNRGIILQYTAPDWIEMARFDPSSTNGPFNFFWNPDEGNATNPSFSMGGTLLNPGAGIYRAANGSLAIASTTVNVATFNTDSVRIGDAMPLLWSSGSPDTVAVRFGFYHGSGSPEGVQIANIGSLYTDWATGDYYHKTSGAGNTGWVIFSSGGSGTTINPTNGFVPYRVNSTTFADSPLFRENATTVRIGNSSEPDSVIHTMGGNGSTTLSEVWIESTSSSSVISIYEGISSSQVMKLNPASADGNIPYFFDTIVSQGVTTNIAKLLEVRNNSTNKFTIDWAGAINVGSVTKAQKATLAPTDGTIVYQTDNTPGFRGYVNGTWFIFTMAADP